MGVTNLQESYTGVPDAKGSPQEGSGGQPLKVQYSGEDFGTGVAKAGENLANTGSDIANHFIGLINETAANNAEAGFIKQAGDLKAQYMQYEGLEAEAKRPEYETQLQALRNNSRKDLPLNAQHAFDSTTTRMLAYQTSEYSSYSAGQVKKANIESQKAIGGAAVSSAGDLGSVLDDTRVGEAMGTIVHSGNAIADATGLGYQASGINSKTGNYEYPDTPEGQAAQAKHLQYTDLEKANYFVTATKTIVDNQGPQAGADWLQKHWGLIPDIAKVKLNQYLAPKMLNADIDSAISSSNNTLAANRDKQLLSNIPKAPVGVNEPQSPSVLDVIKKNEGFTGKVGLDSNGANVLNGVNEKSFPDDYKNLKDIYDTKGKAEGDAATNDFYQKNILDKYDIKSLPKNTQAIVADGLVNHGGGDFGQSLVNAAKNGATPEQLIDMRRTEYKRLADADTDGTKGYAKSLAGWNNRLDSLKSQSEPQQQYSNDFERLTAERQTFIDNAVSNITQKHGTDLGLISTTEKRAAANIDAQIKTAKLVLQSDQKGVQDAINGSLTKGQVPMTIDELKALPNMSPLLEKIQREQPDFYRSIDTRIAKAQHSDATHNSPNAYDAIQATLDSTKPYSRQERIEYLSKGLGSDNPGYSISQKDFNDAKPAVDLNDSRSTVSDILKQISQANGNIDGKGQQRAVTWYNQAMAAWKANQGAEGSGKMSEADFFDPTKNKNLPAMPMPSRVEQLQAHAEAQKASPPVIFTDKKQFDNAPSGTVYIRNGKQYRKP